MICNVHDVFVRGKRDNTFIVGEELNYIFLYNIIHNGGWKEGGIAKFPKFKIVI